MHNISQNIELKTAVAMPDRKLESLKKALLLVFSICTTDGFKTQSMDADIEFNCLKPHLPTLINTIDKNFHLHLAERSIYTTKE